MPAAPQGVTIEPNGQSVVVTFTEQGGGVPTAYADRHGQSTISLPATISTRTTFFFAVGTNYTVSCKVGGLENANGAGGTATIDLTGGGIASLGISVPVETPTLASGTYPLKPQRGPYLLATFYGDAGAQQALSVYVSPDGKNWRSRPNPVYVNSTGSVRDPSIIYSAANGAFYVAHTTASNGAPNGTSFAIIKTTDFDNFTTVATIDCTAATVAVGGTGKTWAPEWFVDTDGSVYIVISINDTSMYWIKATNAALTTWTTPAPFVISGAPASAIDASIIKIGSTYHLFYKNDVAGQHYPEHATSTSPMSGYTVVGSGNWLSLPTMTGSGYEGPCIVQVGTSTWRLYLDNVGAGTGLSYMETTDPALLTGWSALTPCTLDGATASFTLRHGTVLPLTDLDGAAAALVAAIPKPPRAGTSLAYHRHINGSDIITINTASPAWQYVDTGTDAVFSNVQVGALFQIGVSFAWSATASEGHADVVTVTGGAGGTLVTHVGSPVAAGNGSVALNAFANAIAPVVLNDWYTVVAADIGTDGSVRFSLVANVLSGSRGIYATGNTGITFWVRRAS